MAFTSNVNIYVDMLYDVIKNPDTLKFVQFRDMIYDIFIYDMEIGNVMFLLLKKIMKTPEFTTDIVNTIYIDMFSFLQFYNNNYRPIYHLENYLYSLINKIHGF